MDQSRNATFVDRLARLQTGDVAEIELFVSQYEPFIRRALRFRIDRASLRAAADSVDVCQSVLIGFLLRLSAGEYEIGSEDDLQKLLMAIARKKFLRLSRYEMADKRCRARTRSLHTMPELAAPPNESSEYASGNSPARRRRIYRADRRSRPTLEIRVR